MVEGGYPGAGAADPKLDGRSVAAGNYGYKPGDARFAEEKLTALLERLSKHRVPMAFPESRGSRTPAECIPSSKRVAHVDVKRGAEIWVERESTGHRIPIVRRHLSSSRSEVVRRFSWWRAEHHGVIG